MYPCTQTPQLLDAADVDLAEGLTVLRDVVPVRHVVQRAVLGGREKNEDKEEDDAGLSVEEAMTARATTLAKEAWFRRSQHRVCVLRLCV